MGTASHLRSYTGPALLSGGFRPFFLAAGIWGALAMTLWIASITGAVDFGTAFGPVDWHVHEMVFGYGGAVICGFLLTAVPNWTGRLPVAGKPLAILLALWIAGRLAVLFGESWPWLLVAVADLAFLAALTGIIGREIIIGKNRRNLPVLALCASFLGGNLWFHLSAASGEVAYDSSGARIGIAVLILMISLIGGRIVPSFTRNWLAQRGPGQLPIPFGPFDMGVLAVSVLALGLWVARVDQPAGPAMLLAGGAQALRLGRWAGWRTLAEPLVTVLHAAYAFLPAGFLLLGSAAIWPGAVIQAAGLHAWLAGGVGLMTLAVMTRASLGHTGRPLKAGWGEVLIYTFVAFAALSRIAVGLGAGEFWRDAAALAWIAGFTLFAIRYAPILTQPRLAPKRANPSP
ncbi:MAG: NnrS family protein [Paracoccaceae bacterium]